MLASVPELGSHCLRACQAAFLPQVWPALPSRLGLGRLPRACMGTGPREKPLASSSLGLLGVPQEASRARLLADQGEAGARSPPLLRGRLVEPCGLWSALPATCAQVAGALCERFPWPWAVGERVPAG